MIYSYVFTYTYIYIYIYIGPVSSVYFLYATESERSSRAEEVPVSEQNTPPERKRCGKIGISDCRIGGWRAVSAVGLRDEGLCTRSVVFIYVYIYIYIYICIYIHTYIHICTHICMCCFHRRKKRELRTLVFFSAFEGRSAERPRPFLACIELTDHASILYIYI